MCVNRWKWLEDIQLKEMSRSLWSASVIDPLFHYVTNCFFESMLKIVLFCWWSQLHNILATSTKVHSGLPLCYRRLGQSWCPAPWIGRWKPGRWLKPLLSQGNESEGCSAGSASAVWDRVKAGWLSVISSLTKRIRCCHSIELCFNKQSSTFLSYLKDFKFWDISNLFVDLSFAFVTC